MENTNEKKDLTAEQVARCKPVAEKIRKGIVDANLPVGDLKKEEVDAVYDDVVKSAIAEMLSADVQIQDIEVILALVNQPFTLVAGKLKHSFAKNFETAAVQKWGKSPDEVTMSEIDSLIKVSVK